MRIGRIFLSRSSTLFAIWRKFCFECCGLICAASSIRIRIFATIIVPTVSERCHDNISNLTVFFSFFLFPAEYKKTRAELKKRSTDTLRLQKKARKSGKMDDFQRALLDVSEKKNFLEEAERRAVREALIEERRRYCLFVTFLKPVVVSNLCLLYFVDVHNLSFLPPPLMFTYMCSPTG